MLDLQVLHYLSSYTHHSDAYSKTETYPGILEFLQFLVWSFACKGVLSLLQIHIYLYRIFAF